MIYRNPKELDITQDEIEETKELILKVMTESQETRGDNTFDPAYIRGVLDDYFMVDTSNDIWFPAIKQLFEEGEIEKAGGGTIQLVDDGTEAHFAEQGRKVTRAVKSGALTYYETEPLDEDNEDDSPWWRSPDYDELQGYESPDIIDVEDLTPQEFPLALASARARSRFPGIVGRGAGRGVMRSAAPKRKKAKRKTAVKPPNRSKRPSNVFISAANHYGLNPDIYRTRIVVGGKSYSIRKLYKRATKNQVGLVTIPHDDGNEWLITALALKQLLTRNGIDWRP